MRRLRFLPRLGLRARITIAFAVGALIVSTVLAATTWALTRQNLLDQRESNSITLAFGNAEQVQRSLNPEVEPQALQTLLSDLPTPSGAHPVIFYENQWYANDLLYGRDALPTDLVDLVTEGQPASMRFRYRDTLQLAIGIPIPSSDDAADSEEDGEEDDELGQVAYYEIVSLEELEDTLESLGISLIGAALATTLAGAGLGWWAARRVLRPLAGIGGAAEAIAKGRLDTRVEASDDPDLAPLASSFNEMASALEERIQRDTRFASNVSHELRSPLTTLSASITVLENHRDDMPKRAQAALDLMVADVNRFRQLIEDLLEISRFDAGVMHLDLDEVRIAELVMQAVNTSTDADIQLDIDANLAGVVLQADKRRLVRVIANLLDNAAKYAEGATRVELRRLDDDHILIAVEDSGPGVPAEDRYRIFDRFSRGLTAGDRRGSTSEGVGLGLSLVAEHVRLHNGEVWVEDRPDGRSGARFVLKLPAPEPSEEAVEAQVREA